jgi:hypothetical protein
MLTKDRNTPYRDGQQLAVPVGAGQKIFAGALVVALATGLAAKGSTATGLTCLGRAENSVDNSNGGDGDASINVLRGKSFKYKNSSTDAVTQASLGKLCYVEDDETLSATNGVNTQSIAGIVVGIDSDGVWVEV